MNFKNIKYIIFMIFSAIGFSIVQSSVRYLGPSVSSYTKAFYRSLFGLIFLLIWMIITKKKLVFSNKPVLLLRGFMGGLSLVFSFWCIDIYDLSHATFYLYTFPIFAPFFSSLFFREKFKLIYIVPLFISIIGIFFISSINGFTLTYKDLIGLASGISAGIAISTLKELRKTNEAETVYFAFTFISIIVCTLGIIFQKNQYWAFPLTANFNIWNILVILILIGFVSTVAQVLMTTSYKALSTTLASILSILTMPIVTLIAIFIFKEKCNMLNIFGGILIFIAAITIAIIDNKINLEKEF